MMAELFKITFLNRLTHKRVHYLNIGFESKEKAQRELTRILRAQKKRYYTTKELQALSRGANRASIVGTEFKVEPITLKP